VTKSLRPEGANLLEQWIEKRRTLDEVVKDMKDLLAQAFDTAPELKKEQQAGSSP